MTITEFLRARIAEDEEVAQRGYEAPTFGALDSLNVTSDDEGDPGLTYLAVAPARVLAECEAKRRIVEGHAETWDLGKVNYLEGVWRSEDRTIKLLASVYADHPDFNPEWRT